MLEKNQPAGSGDYDGGGSVSDYQLWLGDCLEEMGRIDDGSVDMINANRDTIPILFSYGKYGKD